MIQADYWPPKQKLQRQAREWLELIVAAALAETMVFKFTWDNDTTVSADVSGLKQATGNTKLDWAPKGSNTIELKEPMYVGYAAYRFKDLGGIRSPNSNAAKVRLPSTSFSITQANVELFGGN